MKMVRHRVRYLDYRNTAGKGKKLSYIVKKMFEKVDSMYPKEKKSEKIKKSQREVLEARNKRLELLKELNWPLILKDKN